MVPKQGTDTCREHAHKVLTGRPQVARMPRVPNRLPTGWPFPKCPRGLHKLPLPAGGRADRIQDAERQRANEVTTRCDAVTESQHLQS